jgi:hypothetical protein
MTPNATAPRLLARSMMLVLILGAVRSEAQTARRQALPESVVKGTYTEDDAGQLTLVDGIAWRAAAVPGTVVYLTTKPIASAVLGSTCPVTEARALTLLRDAAWVEVAPDAAGTSKFFTWGRTFGASRGGRESDMGEGNWTITLRKTPPATIAGAVAYRDRGTFDFELPARRPTIAETSGAQAFDDGPRERAATPAEAKAFVAAYEAVRAAALKKDLPGFLAAQGFDAAQVAAIRALPGVDEDFARLSLRFLAKEVKRGKPAFKGRRGAMTAEGTNSEGKGFYNWYYLTKCGTRHLFTTMGENPQ